MRVRSSFVVLGALMVAAAGPAEAHFKLLMPPSWTTEADGKGGAPCGASTPATGTVTKAQGGHPIMVQVMETVYHRGHYRMALSINSRSELPADPQVKDKAGKVLPPTGPGTSDTAAIQKPEVLPILADDVWDHAMPPNGPFTTMVTLPNINCTKCTLQVIEFMADHGADFFYHHCADLQITADPALPQTDAGAMGAPSDGGTRPDGATARDSATGMGGTGGTPATGTGGTGGATGTGGSTGGTAGKTGTAGMTGSTGGTGGSTTGDDGTGGATTSMKHKTSSSGGCAVAERSCTGPGALLALLGVAIVLRRRRR